MAFVPAGAEAQLDSPHPLFVVRELYAQALGSVRILVYADLQVLLLLALLTEILISHSRNAIQALWVHTSRLLLLRLYLLELVWQTVLTFRVLIFQLTLAILWSLKKSLTSHSTAPALIAALRRLAIKS